MGNMSRGCCVRRRTNAGLIGVKTTLNTINHTGTSHAAKDRLEVEGIAEDHRKHSRNMIDVSDDDDQSHDDIRYAHERNDGGSHLDDTLTAAQQAVAYDKSQNRTDDDRGHLCIIERVDRKCGLQIIGAKKIKTNSIGNDQANGKYYAKPGSFQSLLNIVSRAAEKIAIFILPLVDLSQGGLGESRGAADKAHQPHPEYSTGAAHADRRGYTYDVARTNAGCGGYHQSLEGRNVGTFSRLHNASDRFRQHTNLYTLHAEGEVKTEHSHDYDQNGVIHYVINCS
jgi:hypothetical protein